MSMPPIDSPVSSFEVRCRVGQFVMDSDDPDRAPDLVPVGGTVTIEPDLRRPIRVQGETGPRVVGVDPLEFTIDPATGKLIHPDGEPGVELIDPTDEHLDPQGWTYTANVRPEKGRAWTVTFGAPTDDSGIVDLGSVVSVAPSPGVTENYLQQTVTARDQAESFAVRAETAATEAEEWAPSFEWDGTRLVINDGTPVDLKGEKGDTPTWEDLPGKPTSFPSTIPDVQGLTARLAALEYDSGPRDIAGLIRPGYTVERATVERAGRAVTLAFEGLIPAASGSGFPFNTSALPEGFRPAGERPFQAVSTSGAACRMAVRPAFGVGIYGAAAGVAYVATVTYLVPPASPTTLPGTPA